MSQKGFVNIILVIVIVALAGAVGYFTLIRKQWPLTQQTTTPTPSTTQAPAPQTTAPADETMDWKIYRNEKYGFEVKYPPTFEVREEWKMYPETRGDSLPIYVDFSSPSKESFQLGVFSVAVGAPLDQATHWIKNLEGVLRIKSQTNFTVSGTPARKIQAEQLSFSEMESKTTFDPPRPREEVFFIRGTQSYLIHITCGTISTDAFPSTTDFCINRQAQFLDKIVSTFKFTN